MNKSKVLLFKKVCYDIGTRFSFVVNGKIVEAVISDVMILTPNIWMILPVCTAN